MTSQLTIAKVGGGVIDLTGFTGLKGAPYFDRDASLIELRHRFANGEAGQGGFKVMDPDAEIARVDFNYNLPAHKMITWTEDAPGSAVWLFRGRTSQYEGGRGVTLVDNFVEFDVTADDINRDLRFQAFTEEWSRPAETDVARLVALDAYTLSGASSTATNSGDDFEITISSSHLAPNTNTVDMPAKVYPVGTQPQDVVQDCADAAGKVYGVVRHHTGGSHACLLYILESDHSTYASAIKISDNLADWDPEDLTAPVFEPHWEAGKATLFDGQQLLSGLVSIGSYGSVFVEFPSNVTDYGYAVESYYDSTSTTVAQATVVANGILSKRRLTHLTHRVSIIMLPAQVDLVTEGMSLEIKAAAAIGGQYLDIYQTRRVAQCAFEPRHDGTYWCHLELDRATKSGGNSPGKAQPASTSPKPPPVCAVGTGATVIYDNSSALWGGNLGTSAHCGANFHGLGASGGSSGSFVVSASTSYNIVILIDANRHAYEVWTEYWNGDPNSGGVFISRDIHSLGILGTDNGVECVTRNLGFTTPALTSHLRVIHKAKLGGWIYQAHLDSVATAPDNDPFCEDDPGGDSPYFIPSDSPRIEALEDAVEEINQGGQLSWKQPVRVATTVAGTLATSFENGDTIDGVVLETGDRILIKDQAAGSANGIYRVEATGAPTRTADFDASGEVLGAAVLVSEGTANADKVFICTTNAPITLGTTALVFAQIGGSSAIIVQEDDVTVDAAATTLDFTTALNVTSSPAGEANIAVDLGTGATQAAAGNHTHTAGDSAKASATADLAPTTGTAADVTGATLSLAAGTYIVIGNFQAEINSGDRVFEGILDVGGTDENDLAIWEAVGADDGDDQQVVQIWRVALGSTTTVKLQARHSGGTTGDFDVKAANTTITAFMSGGSLGVWATSTPTWTTSGTAPAIGNGTLTARYKALDANTYLYHLHFSAGSTTTFGTGTWSFSLPFTAVSGFGRQLLTGFILDSGTDNKLAVGKVEAGGTTIVEIVPEGGNVVSNASPMTWATNDALNLSGLIEV